MAAYFDKRHDNVLRDIVNLLKIEEIKTFASNHFAMSEYRDAKGRTYPAYFMTKDGFTLLAMGFTGPKALEFKLAYIAAFGRLFYGFSHFPITHFPANHPKSVIFPQP